jgi:hypothetical protein
MTPHQIGERLETLAAIAHGAEISNKLADDDKDASPAYRELLRERAASMMRTVLLGVDELSRELRQTLEADRGPR